MHGTTVLSVNDATRPVCGTQEFGSTHPILPERLCHEPPSVIDGIAATFLD